MIVRPHAVRLVPGVKLARAVQHRSMVSLEQVVRIRAAPGQPARIRIEGGDLVDQRGPELVIGRGLGTDFSKVVCAWDKPLLGCFGIRGNAWISTLGACLGRARDGLVRRFVPMVS